jgi:hypothetical protein
MKYFLFILAMASLVPACKNHPAPGNTSATTDNTTTASAADSSSRHDTATVSQPFFPVASYIGGQVHFVDSLQLPVTKSVTVNHKTALTSLSDAEFHKLALQFRQPDISDLSIKKYYRESSYEDQSIGSVIINYTCTNAALELQKIDLIIHPDPIAGDKIKTIYMEKQRQAGDTIIRQKLYWRADHNFQIITEKQVHSTTLPVEQVKVVWDPTGN